MPSIDTEPMDNSTIRNKALKRLDFPAPVRPTTPIWTHSHAWIILKVSKQITFSPGLVTKDTSFRADGKPSL